MTELSNKRNIICVMVSVGERKHLTNITFPRFSNWCETYGYEYVLLKDNLLEKYGYDRPPHFNKCLVPKHFPGYDEYLVVDDDILISVKAPSLPEIGPDSFLMAKDPVQHITDAPYVQFNGNTGFLLFGKNKSVLFEEVFQRDYTKGLPYKNRQGFTIWGPYDQGPINDIAFSENSVSELDSRFNYALVAEYWLNADKERWVSSAIYRLKYYFSLSLPFHSNAKKMRQAYVLHLINCRFNRYVDFIFNVLRF